MNINEVRLCGRLTKDPQLSKTSSGKSTINFNLAVNDGYGENKRVSFINCVAYEKTANLINQYCKRGDELYCEGRINSYSYDNQKTGRKEFVTNVLVNRLQFGAKPQYTTGFTAFEQQHSNQSEDPFSAFANSPALDITDDNLPF